MLKDNESDDDVVTLKGIYLLFSIYNKILYS